MDRRLFAGSVLSAAVGLALGMQALAAQGQGMDMSKAPQVVKDNMAKMQKDKLEKCYSINTAVKPHRRAIPSRSCCCPPVTAARSRAGKHQRRERQRSDSSVRRVEDSQLDPCRGGDRAALSAPSSGPR